MKAVKLLSTLLLISRMLLAQDAYRPQVPDQITFAGLKVTMTEAVRQEIQDNVDALVRSPKYFQIKVDRADMYFPIIERVLREEGLPDDFKYLAIQESALIADAVSSSNAVGFWQFKKETAQEMGLRVDNEVDERMNIVSATRGAANYLKKHNTYLDNWLHALLSYYAGLGGVQSLIDHQYKAKSEIKLDGKTHWYIKKYLAHKVAFEAAHGLNPQPPVSLIEYKHSNTNTTVADLAARFEVEADVLKEYNKWIRGEKLPADKAYVVVTPLFNKVALVAEVEQANESKPTNNEIKDESANYPQVVESKRGPKNIRIKVNGIDGIVAMAGDNISELSAKGGIAPEKFIQYNDLKSNEALVAGQVYYLKLKKSKAQVHYHTVKEGETMWSISQKYGLRLDRLAQKNRMKPGEEAQVGRVLWLKFIRPDKQEIEFRTPVKATQIPVVNTTSPIGQSIEEDQDATTDEEEEEEEEDEIATLSPFKKEEDQVVKSNLMGQDTLLNRITETKNDTIKEERFEAADNVRFVESEIIKPILNTIEHKVAQGETLFGIARKYAVTVTEICEWNGITPEQGIKMDSILKIKTGRSVPEATQEIKPMASQDTFLIHVVEAGETMYKVARDYGVTVKDIMELNNKQDFTLSAGERLKIKKIE